MKQKIFYGALLLGALTLSSCVDNNETASVTNIRQSKAEQLKSIANLYSSNASSLLVSANAEAAAREAEAEYSKAEAAYYQALAAHKDAQTDAEKQEAQQAAEKFANEMKEAQNKLDLAAAQFEIDMMNAKKDLVDAQAEYDAALKAAEDNKSEELQELLGKYQAASQALIDAKNNLASANLSLTSIKTGIITVTEGYEQMIANNNDLIADYQTEVDKYNAELEAYAQYTTLTEAQEAKESVQKESDQLYNDYRDKIAIRNKANTTRNDASSALSNSAYRQQVEKFMRSEYSIEGVYITYVYEYANNRPTVNNNKYCAQYRDDEAGKTVNIPLFTSIEFVSPNPKIEYSYGEGLPTQTYPYSQYTAYYDLVEGGFDSYFKLLEAKIAANQGKALTDAQKAYTDAQTAQTAAATAVTTAENKLADAKKALEAAADADKADAQAAVDAAQNDLDAKKAALAQAENEVDYRLTMQNNAEDALENVNKELDNQKAGYQVLVDNAAANTANMNAYNEANKAYAEAYAAYRVAYNAYSTKVSELNAINNVINDYNDITWRIDNAKWYVEYYSGQIEGLQKANEELEQNIEDAKNDPDKAAQMKGYEAYIAQLQDSIAVLQKNYDGAKAALDAAMADDAATEE